MAGFEDYGSKFTARELEFFAEDELVTIQPNFSMDALDCIGGEYGPFVPNVLTDVPLWMALALHKRKRAVIVPPDWMEPESLARVLEEERRETATFEPLPFYYIEIAVLLLRSAKDTFGEKLYRVQSLVEQVRKVRMNKIQAGLALLDAPLTVKLNNLSSMECNMIRPFFLSSLDRYYRHAQMSASATHGDVGSTQPDSQPMQARQLRRGGGL